MAVRYKFPVVDRRIVFEGNGVFSPTQRRKAFADAARASIVDIDAQNDAAVGRDVQYRTFADGREVRTLVEADHEIIARWELGAGVVEYIAALLAKSGPILTGRYRKTFKVYADGREIGDTTEVIGAREALFVPTVPYARKIERGKGGYAPGHVYEAVAAMANARFSNVARIKFTYAEPEGPAPMLDAWAARNAAREQSATRQRAKMRQNRRQPAIIVYLT